MDKINRKRIKNWAIMVIGEEEVERFYSIPFEDTGFGYDIYGCERECMLLVYTVGLMLYKDYFRVESVGIKNVPTKGRAIFAANRMGPVPYYNLMCFVDMITNLAPPRLLRIPMPKYIWDIAFAGLISQRTSPIVDSRRNLELVLNREGMLLIAPEEKESFFKLLVKRNKLAPFNSKIIELCLSRKTPIIPAAFYSSEESTPIVGSVRSLISSLRLDQLPLKLDWPISGLLNSLPLPSKLHISYAEPIAFYEEYPVETIEHPNLLQQMADVVGEHVRDLINSGVAKLDN